MGRRGWAEGKPPNERMTTALMTADDRRGKVSFESFRRWALSDDFPETGRHDFVNGRYVKDLAPEPLFSHNAVKGAIAATLMHSEEDGDLLTIAGARVTTPACELSVQPDVSLTKWRSFDTGRVTLTPHPNRPDDAIEIVGPPDLVVEVVSDSSVGKDTCDLYRLYFDADVREYWLVDARGAELTFRLLARGRTDWNEVASDADGFYASPVLGRRYRLDREAGSRGEWQYDLIERELA
jgi:Uma2 family endonuclease